LNNFLSFFRGNLWGRSPQPKLWEIKAEGLNYRVGGLIEYDFLDKEKFLDKPILIIFAFSKNFFFLKARL